MSRRQAKRLARARQQLALDLQFCLEQPQFRRVVANLVALSGVDQVTAFTGNSQTFYNQGRHDFVRQFLADLRAVSLPLVRLMEDEAIAAASAQSAPLPDDGEGEDDLPD